MDSSSGWNMYVFRDGRARTQGEFLVQGLRSSLRRLEHDPSPDARLNALLWSGELECALADASSPQTSSCMKMTEALAASVLDFPTETPRQLLAVSEHFHLPGAVSISPPEGFAFYALHPVNFAELARRAAHDATPVAVLGIRSIGTTLSAIVTVALRQAGIEAERITVRPTGHPYDRELALTPDQRVWVRGWRAFGGKFMVADEGPGISGSSFLSVGEALVREGVSHDRISFLGSRPAQPGQLLARDAASRWSRFNTHISSYEAHLRCDDDIYIGSGRWRSRFIAPGDPWPAAWTSMERSKFLSADGRSLLKFEGYGRFGQAVADRIRSVAKAGFGPRHLETIQGFGRHEFLPGRMASRGDLSREVLERLADYCAFRARVFRADDADTRALGEMLSANWRFEFDEDLPSDIQFEVRQSVIADARMMPHEWLIDPRQPIMKVDSASHGDDHFFPGPTDIAWDLAGTIIEWGLAPDAISAFLRRYTLMSGDDPQSRLSPYLLAYSVFRFAYSKMAAHSMAGCADEPWFMQDYQHYRRRALGLARREVPIAA